MPRRRTQFTLAVWMLWVLVAAVYCWNLKILADHREEVALIWETLIR